MAAINRMAMMAMIVSAVTMVLFGVMLGLGGVALNERLHPKKPPKVLQPLPGPLAVIRDQVYNLAEPLRFVKATIVFELATEGKSTKEAAAFVEEMKKRDSQIRDIVIRVMNGVTFLEVNSPHGKSTLKETIRKKVNEVLARGEIKSVLFTTFAMQ
ncbi:MAG: flagellar basal body-associated FliL family protein [Candidatus Coatesbacteria bacterium]